MDKNSIHQFTVKDASGKEVSLGDYKGKALLIVNTASQCGFTPQLDDMEKLYEEFKEDGFEVLAFPSNDFAGQEPLDGEAIQQFCMTKYNAQYPIFEKTVVKGKDASPLFKFLSDKKLNGKVSSKPKWNFHKYLVDKEGKVVDYYYSITNPTSSKIKRSIKKILED
ncbi:MAG: glutathione peroxidase [Saprospiraceae bacterium]